jgi:hypothetical protein
MVLPTLEDAMSGPRPERVCPYCAGRFRRLDRHLAGRGACGVAEDRAAALAASTSTAPEAGADPVMPGDLGPAGHALWARIAGAYQVTPGWVTTLEAACREADRAERAEQAVAEAGEWQTDRYGRTVPHAGVQVARSSRLAMARLLRELHLDLGEETPT